MTTHQANLYSAKALRIVGTLLFCLSLWACGGGTDDTEPSTLPISSNDTPKPTVAPQPSATLITSVENAQRFMSFAGFGANMAELNALVDTDAADWLKNQFDMPYKPYLDRVLAKSQISQPESRNSTSTTSRHQLEMFWDAALGGEDVLRQRMIFALSQIIVARETDPKRATREAYYLDMLGQNAFGNYKDILLNITYTPLMGRYLTYINNRKGDPTTGRLPDENYAREILQLFSVGVVDLEMNGKPKLVNGTAIETYDNDDIVNLARVFTGLQFDPAEQGIAAHHKPMVMNENRHSLLEKRFLDVTIPSNTSGTQSIELAIDGIFSHPNVAPFIARQLIQRFTASSPEPDYVERVAQAFETGSYTADNGTDFGSGDRGDLEATLAAILLEPSLFIVDSSQSSSVQNRTKIREPVLRFAHWARAFTLQNIDSAAERRLRNTSSLSASLGQQPFASPSVFNFYRPGYVASGTRTAQEGLTAPEFQIVNTASAIGYINFMTDFIVDNTANTSNTNTFVPDYSNEIAMAHEPQTLVEHLSILLTGGRMTEESKLAIVETIESIEIRSDNEDDDRLARVRFAIIMATSDPSFTVIY